MKKTYLLSFFLLLAVFSCQSSAQKENQAPLKQVKENSSPLEEKKSLSESEAVSILKKAIEDKQVYERYPEDFVKNCFRYSVTKKDETYIYVSLYEKHQGETCPGDPNSEPKINDFRIHKENQKIELYNFLIEINKLTEWISLEQYKNLEVKYYECQSQYC